MYNHYIPQSDGSYRRSSIPDPPRQQQHRPPMPFQRPEHRPEPEQSPQKTVPEAPPPPQEYPPAHNEVMRPQRQELGILSSLRRLLPKEIDSFDLVIIVLLLMLSQDENDGDIAPLLTIALYFLL